MTNNDPILEKIIVARIGLFFRHPFFGSMATRLKIEDASDWCKTAATDGRHIFYNRDFFEKLSEKEIEFVIAHEVLHNAFGHLDRIDGRDPNLWNIAIDYATNGILVDDGIGRRPSFIDIYYDPVHKGKSSEQIYEEICKHAIKIPVKGCLLDEHVDWTKPDDKRPHYTPGELRKIRDDILESMVAACQAAGAGNIPVGIQRLVKNLTEPKMSWRQIIRQQIQGTVRTDYSFQRPNRKGHQSGAILPSMNFGEAIDVCIGLDMSGSITSRQAKDFLSEVKGIMDEFRDYNLTVMSFDTEVHNVKKYNSQDGEDFSEYTPVGGGGTKFECVWDYLKSINEVPKKLLIFTDMEPWGSWGDPDYCSTIFLAHGTKTIVAPFGETVYFE